MLQYSKFSPEVSKSHAGSKPGHTPSNRYTTSAHQSGPHKCQIYFQKIIQSLFLTFQYILHSIQKNIGNISHLWLHKSSSLEKPSPLVPSLLRNLAWQWVLEKIKSLGADANMGKNKCTFSNIPISSCIVLSSLLKQENRTRAPEKKLQFQLGFFCLFALINSGLESRSMYFSSRNLMLQPLLNAIRRAGYHVWKN